MFFYLYLIQWVFYESGHGSQLSSGRYEKDHVVIDKLYGKKRKVHCKMECSSNVTSPHDPQDGFLSGLATLMQELDCPQYMQRCHHCPHTKPLGRWLYSCLFLAGFTFFLLVPTWSSPCRMEVRRKLHYPVRHLPHQGRGHHDHHSLSPNTIQH